MFTQGYFGPYAVRMPRYLVILVLIAACGTSTSATSTSTSDTSPTTILSTTTTAPPGLGCPLDEEFTSVGRIARITQPTSDSKALGLISVQASGGCERLGFDFETVENAPATTPPSVDAEFLEGGRIVRIHLDIDQTVITDQLLGTPLAERLYVVRSLDGELFVDVHMAAAAAARVTVSNSPAGLTLELSPRQADIGTPPAISARTVLITPDPNQAVSGPEVDVAGYSRVFEANMLIVATSGGAVVAQQATTAADWVDTWGEFEATLTLEPASVDLFVGEESPEDGSLEGVTLKLEVR